MERYRRASSCGGDADQTGDKKSDRRRFGDGVHPAPYACRLAATDRLLVQDDGDHTIL